jgi:hypothetical protein
VQRERRRGRKSRGSTALGVTGRAGENDREEVCVPDKLDDGGYAAYASRVLECRAIATLSENLSSCGGALSELAVRDTVEPWECDVPDFYESTVARGGQRDTRTRR